MDQVTQTQLATLSGTEQEEKEATTQHAKEREGTQESTKTHTEVPETHPTLPPPLGDEANFPRLPSPTIKGNGPIHSPPREVQSPEPAASPHFIWNSKRALQENPLQTPSQESEKRSGTHTKIPDSTPITRQGYRSGRLAEDFWLALKMPNTPIAAQKILQVVPLLIKNDNTEGSAEYLVDKKPPPGNVLVRVQIAELLAGIPWTESRVKQHVVNEVAQTLHKLLVFTTKITNPLQKWGHGKWVAIWDEDHNGTQTCTLYVSVPVQEAKIKPRKHLNLGWKRVPEEIWCRFNSHNSEDIVDITENRMAWHQLLYTSTTQSSVPHPPISVTTPNRFSALGEEAAVTTSKLVC